MDIQELEAFWWIAKTGSFNKAAEKLFLTQPSVTARIQTLEKELGQPLFERKPRGVRLTDAGRVLLPHAERVLLDIRKARQAISDLGSASGGTLMVGAALTTSTYALPEILAKFKLSYPAVEVAMHTGRSQQIQQLVLEDYVPLGFVHSPIATHPEIEAIPLYSERIVLVVPPGHTLAGRTEVTAEQLASEAFITSDRASGYWSLVEQFWATAGIAPRVTMELDSIEATKRMVMYGLGLALLPQGTVEGELKTRQLVIVPVAGMGHLTRQTLLIHRKGKVWSGITRGFLQILSRMYQLNLPIAAQE
ncbi:MAG: LysR family transcriptional regulator [Symbiobacteriaceae bacterium]|jgi:DNA-binding transcriptional LysR family regulator|nr:LysR family transcriptional regulator [Symbiobacteriaceae bacterium]